MKNMKTKEILAEIAATGGFDNYQHWNRAECAEWVMANYPCTQYVANNVAYYIVDGYARENWID